MSYIPPSNKNIPFEFGNFGYKAPDFDNIPFEFGRKTIDLKTAITGMGIQPDYLKSCDTYVIGHSSGQVQTFKSNCIYGGFRDLQIFLTMSYPVVTDELDLPIDIKPFNIGHLDLRNALRIYHLGYKELPISIKSWNTQKEKDLPVFLKQGQTSQDNLIKFINIFQHAQKDLQEVIKGWAIEDIKDLINTIKPWSSTTDNLIEFIRSTTRDTSDLILNVFKIWQRNTKDLGGMLHGWQILELQKIIQAVHINDLNVILRVTFLSDITAILYAIQPVDISADILGWATQDLPVSIARGVYAGDLPTFLYGVPSEDLKVFLSGKLGIQVIDDLNARMTNLQERDLPINLNLMFFKDLNIHIESSRQLLNLQCMIYPKVVFIRHNININFLEYEDLKAVINYSCFGSDFRELRCSLDVHYKKDLKTKIYAMDGSNLVNLPCYVNAYEYVTIDSIPVNYLHLKEETRVTLQFKKSNIYSLDTIRVFCTDIHKGYKDITSAITGELTYDDLRVVVRPYSNRHYSSPTVLEKFITLKLKNNEEEFKRYVELTFNSYANSYYYFSGNQRAYREFSQDHWVVRVEGYKILPVGRGFEREKVRRKYIFNLKKYNSIDEAIRDMIDRVTALREQDLNVTLTSIPWDTPPIDGEFDLKSILVPRKGGHTTRTLRGVVRSTATFRKELPVFLRPTKFEANKDIVVNINGIDYGTQLDTSIDFNFTGSGDTKLSPDDVDFTFIFGED